MTPQVSVIIPVFNEEASLTALFERLYPAMDRLLVPYEILFVDDGSRDTSVPMLRAQFERRPDCTRVIVLASNAGQHMAILAGFEAARGNAVITLDADLQNPPEEIAKLLAALDAGADYVGTVRKQRQDVWWRTASSRLMNRIRERITHIRITDQGCMLRAYGRNVVDAVNRCNEVNTFVPALAYLYARRPVEIEVEHSERTLGQSKYSLHKLIRLNFDLMTGFSLVPLQVFTLVGMIISVLSLALVVLLAIRRLVVGPEAEGLFTLFCIVFFFIGVLLFGLGVVGEYVGRIYVQVRQRPRFVVATIIEQETGDLREPADVVRLRAEGAPRNANPRAGNT
jgi:undecaprenyl-phosphate 4-deoxy-4-formamido-L-arabinose transferase